MARNEDLEAFLTELLDASKVEGLRRLSGGASRETWSFDAVMADGTVTPLILRRDPPGAAKGGMTMEGALLRAASEVGVPVPRVHAADTSFLVMERVEGETIPRKILREDDYADARPKMARQCGEILAALHRIPVDAVPGLESQDQVAQFRAMLDSLGHPHPMFELAFRWLEANRPAPTRTAVVHGDFRHGNLIVGPDGVRSVLDWELAHVGDAMEDLGWLCVKAWRFGEAPPVGGFGTYDDLIAGYEDAGGDPVDRDSLRWWEILGTLKWGIMCILQATAHTSGAVRSVELATIGRRVCENEWDLAHLLPPPYGDPRPRLDDLTVPAPPATPPHDIPTAAGLVEAVREFLERDVMKATEGRVQFHTRVAVNALSIVERELALGPNQVGAHAAGLANLGVASDAELADAVRTGKLDDRLAEVSAFVARTVEDKLRVANPKYF